MARRPAQLPEVHAEEPQRTGPSRFTTTVQIGGRVARPVHLRRSRHAVEHRGAQPDVSSVAAEPTNDYRGRASVLERHRQDPGVRAVPRGHAVAVHDRRRQGALRSTWISSSDGARSAITGDVDLGALARADLSGPVAIDFPTQKDIFFHGQKFTVSGTGDFTGTFHLFKGGRELKGTFTSPVAGVNAWRFPNLRGSVLWAAGSARDHRRDERALRRHARASTTDGAVRPAGTPARATWDVEYTDVDLARLTDFLETQGLRLAGRAIGTQPPRVAARQVGAEDAAAARSPSQPPAGVRPMTRELPAGRASPSSPRCREEAGPFNSHLSLGYLPIAGRIVYALDPEWIRLDDSWAATETHLRRVRRADGVRRAVAHPVPRDQPRLAGERPRARRHHDGVRRADRRGADRRLRRVRRRDARRVHAAAHRGHVQRRAHARLGRRCGAAAAPTSSIENSYVFVSNAIDDRRAGREIRADGQFSLGYPRKDGGEEIDARVRITRRPLGGSAPRLRARRLSGRGHGLRRVPRSTASTRRPFGFGRLTIDEGIGLRRDVRARDRVAALRGQRRPARRASTSRRAPAASPARRWSAGTATTRSTPTARGSRSSRSQTVAFPQAPLSGLLQFTATGAGTFDEPRYDVKLRRRRPVRRRRRHRPAHRAGWRCAASC